MEDAFYIILACLAIAVLVGIGFMLVMWLRRKMWKEEDETGDGATGFSLGDLRKLHREGKLSAEEFERAKGMIIATAKRNAEARAAALAKQPNRRPAR